MNKPPAYRPTGGPVYQHFNPDGSPGGIVAKTAIVGMNVWIFPGASVGPYAVIGDGAEILPGARICMNANVAPNRIVKPGKMAHR